MTGVVHLLQNPSDPYQMYALWDTGRIDPFGGALPIKDGPTWFDRTDPPGRALHISDWNGPSGYVLDYAGGFQAFGGAVSPGSGDYPQIMPGVPYTGEIKDVQGNGPPRYVDWGWNPDNSGQGYALDYYGQLYHFGGATACPRQGPLWGEQYAIRFDMQWEPFKRSVILDYYGGRNQDFPRLELARDGYYDPRRNWARDMVITDWGDNSPAVAPSGYLLLADGDVREWGPRQPQNAFAVLSGGQQGAQTNLGLISPTNPLIMVQVGVLGQQTIYTSSTPPSVIAGGLAGSPASVVTDTTRPLLAWSYSDPQRDRQAEWQLVVWPQSYVDMTDMTDPRRLRGNAAVNESGNDSTTRGITSPVDLDDGTWRMYIRAKDTAGQWSAWANRGWTQDVPDLLGPTDLLATVEGDHVNLTLFAVPVAGPFALFEASDDQGLTWSPVRAGEAVPLLAVTRAVDRDVPLGLPRTYRGRLFTEVPRKLSAPSVERTVTVENYEYLITSCDDPTLGGVFAVTDLDWSRPRSVGEFDPLGGELTIVINDGGVRSRRGTISIDTWSRAEYDRLVAVLSPASTLLVRDQFGGVVYCRVVGDWDERLMRAAPMLDEVTGLRHAHVHDLPLREVARPLPVPAEVV